ncbi:stage II sporulation protein R [Massilioclostridium coli]|uniref:stage II sporulation protein R n=1 Tax=Massilioclostridium coli TaxID=1870991 RepID=UPI0022E538FA|nr:stage II sporulation protein R [Massilioclostridium coli]
MKKAEVAVLFGLILAIMVGSFVGFEADCREISQSVFRLHILANSDSQEDQDLKLKVRDRILQDTQGLFESTGDLQQTEEQVAQHLPEIREIALDEIHKQGYSYDVQIYMVNMWFETRTYDTITLPAGNYDALRIVIGSGEGHNWWCVLYPPLCVPAAEPQETMDDVLNQQELEVVNSDPKYEVRFAVLEWWEKLKQNME